MRLLVADGRIEDAVAYVTMLPRSKAFHSALLKACMEAGDLATLQQLIQASSLSLRGGHHRICSVCLQRHVQVVLHAIFMLPSHSMQARELHGQAQDEYSYSAVITAASRAGDQAAVRQAFAEAAAARLANAAVCNATIEALSRAGDTEVRLAGSPHKCQNPSMASACMHAMHIMQAAALAPC
jgi:hypothetical protein